MKIVVQYIFYFFLRFLLFLRYRIKIEGLEKLKKASFDRPGGILFLANHPAEVDPCILLSLLWPRFHPHPVGIDYLFRNRVVRYFLDLVAALPVPHFEHGTNSYKKREMEKSYKKMFDLLRNRENILIYPSGGLKRQSEEMIGGASGIQTILQNCPEANVVLIRTIGLWGSSFSRAQTGVSPHLIQTAKERCLDLLKNAIFFSPKRHLRVVIEQAPKDFPIQASRLEINRYLEKWYNQDGPEPLYLVPYLFWKKTLPKVVQKSSSPEKIDFSHISEEIISRITEEIAHLSKRNPLEIHHEQFLARDLGLDSLDLAQLILFLKENFGVNNVYVTDLIQVQDLFALAARLKTGKLENNSEEKKLEKKSYPSKKRPFTTPPQGETLQEAFLNAVDRMGSHTAAADLFLGEISYKRLKLAALLIAEKIKKLPHEKIGIMMPASVTANILILAVLMAKKLPVMINWTLGRRNLEAIVHDIDLRITMTSWNFLDRLENTDLTGIDDKILLIEDLMSSCTWKEKLKILCRLPYRAQSLLRTYHLNHLSEDETAVILFTSGTESLPKAVPLSHKNLMSCQRGGYEKVAISSNDVLLGVLPPFHSFGFSITGLFPILAGLQVVYFPNPTDGKKIVSIIERWGVTMLFIVPTFLKNILRVASSEQIKTLRLVITGAEKMSLDMHEKFLALNPSGILAEGYGITECGPILTLNPINKPQKGVGEPLKGVDILIVDIETYKKYPVNKEGLILVRGPNIFKGYLNSQIKSPFIEIEGTFWYNTGDLGFLDERGFLTLSGRLKRFVKVGGEMISLMSIEEILIVSGKKRGWNIDPDAPSLAVIAKEEEGKKGEIHLITTFVLGLEEANEVLKENGMSNLIRISKIRSLSSIPLLGTGKIDYKALSLV